MACNNLRTGLCCVLGTRVLLWHISTEAGIDLKMSFSIYFIVYNIHIGSIDFSINFLFYSDNDPLEGKQLLMQVEMSIMIPGRYHRLSNVLETDGQRTNIHFLQPERDSSSSNRLGGPALTWLSPPACSVSHFRAAFSFSCLVDSPGMFPCA